MKTLRILSLGACALLLAMPATALAAKKGNKGDKTERKAINKVLRQSDADQSGSLEGAEIESVRKAFDADKTGPLKSLDTNNDGSLSDTEITAVKPHVKGQKGANGGKKKKKNL